MNQPKLRALGGLLMAALALCSLAGCATQSTKQTAAAAHAGKHMTVRTTAYTHTEKGGIRNAVGERLHFGGGGAYSAASDWSWLPLGTRFRIMGTPRTYVIEDYGSALVGRETIDLYVPSRHEMNAWGVRHVEIEILEWGSKAMSLKMLQPRTGHSHVRMMVAQLRKQGISPPG